jgi:hypothetical protein
MQPGVATRPAQNAAIVPQASDGSDASLGLVWQPVQIESNRSCSCLVTAPAGHSLTVRVEQPPYDRTLQGTGQVNFALVPPAPIGTKGRLIARDETSGGLAEYTWEWREIGKAKWVSPSKAATRVNTAQANQPKTRSGQSAAVKFCGLPSQGWRFAFILDKSGSMTLFGEGKRWETCKRELFSALSGLPANAEIFVILFSDVIAEPPGQTGWMEARPEWIKNVVDWISSIQPSGGTLPKSAFEKAFSLGERPDAIYFLTDGQFSDISFIDLKKMCGAAPPPPAGAWAKLTGFFRDGKDVGTNNKDAVPTIINTITLEDASAAGECKKIAAACGGEYAHVSAG